MGTERAQGIPIARIAGGDSADSRQLSTFCQYRSMLKSVFPEKGASWQDCLTLTCSSCTEPALLLLVAANGLRLIRCSGGRRAALALHQAGALLPPLELRE